MKKNRILEDHGGWLLVDISTKKYPNASMAIDKSYLESHKAGRFCATGRGEDSVIYAVYKRIGEKGVVLVHQEVAGVIEGLEIDHISPCTNDFVDNRVSNLRHVTHSQNMMNRTVQSNNSSGMSGISYYKARRQWEVYINIGGGRKKLGYFDNIEIAQGVRMQAELEYFGGYAYKGG